MKHYLKDRHYSDYEDDVLLHEMNGAVVEEINHKFPAAFRPFLSAAVTRRFKNFLNLRLTQTGHLPAINTTADKGTYKHRTRQFLSCVTLVPVADDLLQVISFGQPIVKGHKGFEIAQNIKECLDIFGIKYCQIEGGSFDGQYFNLGVQAAMESGVLYNLPPNSVLWFWDAMHKIGLVDKEYRVKWLVDDADLCSQISRCSIGGRIVNNL